MSKLLTLFALSVCLLTPAMPLGGQDHHDDTAKTHQWSDNENPAWHQYLKEHHKKDHDWAKASKREQSDYWKWRDKHQDVH